MKRLLSLTTVLLTIFFPFTFVFSAPSASTATVSAQADTSAYQTQRLKINALLAERSSKFGQYDESLSTRSGIFGFQSKKDIKNSNEILRQIVLNDNNIFKELKVLLDYKDLEVQEVQNTMASTSGQMDNYKLAIKKLQDQNQALSQQIKTQEQSKNMYMYAAIVLLVILIVTIFSVSSRLRAARR